MSNDGSAYPLHGYGIKDFIAAFETAFKEKPEVYWYMLSILRRQPIHISGEDMRYLQQEPKPIVPLIPGIIIENNLCEICGYYHPGGTCMDS